MGGHLIVDTSHVVSGKGTKVAVTLIRTNEPAIVALLQNVDRVALTQLQLVGIHWTVIEHGAIAKSGFQLDFNFLFPIVASHLYTHDIGSLAVSTCRTSVFRMVFVSRTTSELGVNDDGDGKYLVTVVVVVMTFSRSSLPIS